MLGNRSKHDIKKSVKKATDSRSIPSKEKHVRAIILRTFTKDNSVELVIKYLSMRLDKTNWAVVLKTLMIFHRCFRDGDSAFIESMKPRSSQIFALQKFSATAPSTHLYTVFVKKYAKYLEEKVSVLRLLGFQFEKNKDAVKGLATPKCFKTVPKLQSQLNALLNCKMRTQHIGSNSLIHKTYILIMKDSITLYAMLNESIIQLLDMFWKMNKKNASKVISIYKLFVKETDALISLYEIGKRFIKQVPEIKKAETTIIEALEKHVEDLDDHESSESGSIERSGGGAGGAKKAKKKKTAKKEEHSSDAELKEEEHENYDDYEEKDKKYDDDTDEEGGDQSSSDEGEDEPDDLLKDFFTPNNNFSNLPFQQPLVAPSFGPGAQVIIQPPQEPSYQEKANFIKQIAVASESAAFTPNPFGFQQQPMGMANPFGGGVGVGGGSAGALTVNPFQQAATPNPFGTNVANPFGNTAGGSFASGGSFSSGGGTNFNVLGSTGGSSAGVYASGGVQPNTLNPFGSTGNPTNRFASNSPYGSTSGVNANISVGGSYGSTGVNLGVGFTGVGPIGGVGGGVGVGVGVGGGGVGGMGGMGGMGGVGVGGMPGMGGYGGVGTVGPIGGTPSPFNTGLTPNPFSQQTTGVPPSTNPFL